MNRRELGELVQLPSPLERLQEARVRGRFGYVWEHDVKSREFQACSLPARLVYMVLCYLADSETQTVEIGRSKLAELCSMDRSNLSRPLDELEARGLVRAFARQASTKGGATYHLRTVYALLCPPSAFLRDDDRQLALPFRRLRISEGASLRAARGR